uniref:EGF-like domain-containing protein n=1 Tax=Branchiostoma floridae TaxID=7739 RepID=C3ZYT2_BRAFL|eukprot:XP_002586275.1 hypothetical protein BRAFLDRAFT_109276 [Branchiostoma floridae]
MTKPIGKLQDHPKEIHQHGADDTGSYADVRLKANPMYGAQNEGLYMCPDTPNTPEGTDGRGNVDAETPRISYREVTERDANQPAVMLGSGLTRPAPPLPPPGNLASEEQVTVSGPEQNEELYMCSDTPNTPEGTETPGVSYRGTSEYKSSEVTERDANQPAVMLGSGLTRPAPPLPPPRNLASGEQVTVSGPEQNEELYMCPDTPNTPEGTDGRGDDDAEIPRVSYRDRAMGMWNKMKSSKVCRLLMGCGFVIGTVALTIGLTETHVSKNRLIIWDRLQKSAAHWETTFYKVNRTNLANDEGTRGTVALTIGLTETHVSKNRLIIWDRLQKSAAHWETTFYKVNRTNLANDEGTRDINECAMPRKPCQHGDCENKDGGYNCTCQHGWTGQKCQSNIFTKEEGRFFGDWPDHIADYNSIDADECARRCLQGYGSYDGVKPPCLSFNHRPAGSPEGGSARCWLRSSDKDTAASPGSEWDTWPHRNYYQKKAPTYYNPLDHESTFFTPNGHTMDEGVSGSALKLESRRSQYANLGNFAGTCFGSTLNCPRGFSLAFWFKRPDGDIHAQYYINSGGHDPTRTRGFTLTKTLVDLDNDLYTFAVNGRLFRHQAKVYLLPDLWTHVAVTWLEERGLEIFVNGSVQQVAVFETKIPPLENDPYTDVYLGSDNIRPGMYTHTGEAVFDELKFWDWVLPDGQIQLAMIPGSDNV